MSSDYTLTHTDAWFVRDYLTCTTHTRYSLIVITLSSIMGGDLIDFIDEYSVKIQLSFTITSH